MSARDPFGRSGMPDPYAQPTEVQHQDWISRMTPIRWIVGILLLLAVFIAGCGAVTSIYKTGPTEVAVVRNAGPLDNRTIDTITGPSSSLQIPGFFQEVRKYIASNEQRFFTISSDPDESDSGNEDFVQVPTADGVQVRLDATAYFNTAFDDTEEGKALVAEFDSQFGNREFDGHHVWDGTNGWNAWLGDIFRPVLENTIREEIGSVNCAELISSCALIQQSQTTGGPDFTELAEQGAQNQANLEAVQQGIEEKLGERVNATLGEAYLRNISFRLVRVTLPDTVQTAIDDSQASFAQISQAKAQEEKAKFDAERARQLVEQYGRAGLAQLEMAKELKDCQSCTIILGGDSFALPTR